MKAAKQLIQAEIDRLETQQKQLNATAGQTLSNQVRIAYVNSADHLNGIIGDLKDALRVLTKQEAPEQVVMIDPLPELIPTEEDADFQRLADETHAQFLEDEKFEQKRDQDI
ncbi:VHS1119 protein [Vibrio phage 1]|nr:VHS1119 protein [Vibrio phage 1]